MLNSVARKYRPAAGIELDWDADDERALRVAQTLGDELLDIRVRQGLLVLRERRAVERRLPLELPVLGRKLLHIGHDLSVGRMAREARWLCSRMWSGAFSGRWSSASGSPSSRSSSSSSPPTRRSALSAAARRRGRNALRTRGCVSGSTGPSTSSM